MYNYPKLTRGFIHNRYKRFLADIDLASGERVTAHCPNTGSMRSCWQQGAPVLVSHSDNPKRKLQWTLECVDMGSGWVGVNTSRVNNIIAMAVDKQEIPALQGYEMLKKEPRIDFSSFPPSRFDLLLSSEQRKTCYVEIKNATLLEAQTILFPDVVTERGRKHLLLLDAARKRGFRAVILFAINRPEGHFFRASGSH